MTEKPKLLEKEFKTIVAMVEIYCGDHHKDQEGICSDCQALLDYASERLCKCPFGKEKPKCSKCEIHCYKPEMREKVRNIMKYSGPRMLTKHPVMAVQHLMHGAGKKPPKPGSKK